jgi:hypothetical protein
MFDLDLLWNARWEELYLFMVAGDPPLIQILLGINTVFFILFLFRRASARHRMRPSTVYFVQGAMILANAFALFRDDTMHYIMRMKGIL